jgi:hypothetical protein
LKEERKVEGGKEVEENTDKKKQKKNETNITM